MPCTMATAGVTNGLVAARHKADNGHDIEAPRVQRTA